MALKYYFEFKDVKNILHRCEIYKDSFVGDAIEVKGSLSLNKAGTEDTLESIRGGGLKIDLEANLNLTFSDFYSENERQYSVKYIRNTSVLLFYGWLSPEGLYESFVDDKWVISLDCTDGLGFLKNLSYVENATGLPFSGKQSALQIIVNCLKRTNLSQNIYSKINIFHENMDLLDDVLAETYLNSNRFVKEDKGVTYMNCDEVLRSVLEPFGACITQYQGSWIIYKPNELFDNTSLNVFAYDSNGLPKTPAKTTFNFSQNLGSQINNFYPHHSNANQQITVDSAIGAYRINYKYGLVNSFFDNIQLKSYWFVPLLYPLMDEWNITDYTYLDFPADERGLILDHLTYANPFPTPLKVMTSDSFAFGVNNVLGFNVVLNKIGFNVYKSIVKAKLKVILTDGTNTYYLDNDGLWVNSDTFISIESSVQLRNYNIQSAKMPISGNVYIEIYTPIRENTQGGLPQLFISECNFYPVNLELEDIEGENHTFEINENPSTKIEKTKEVFNGDNPSDSFVGTIYEGDQTTPTELWYRNELLVRFTPLLQIMGEERMTMYAKPLRVFSGDVFGYIDYLSVVAIDGIENVLFMPIEYDYDALTNTTKLKLKQILNNPLITNVINKIDYSLDYDYGNVVEPTIKG